MDIEKILFGLQSYSTSVISYKLDANFADCVEQAIEALQEYASCADLIYDDQLCVYRCGQCNSVVCIWPSGVMRCQKCGAILDQFEAEDSEEVTQSDEQGNCPGL